MSEGEDFEKFVPPAPRPELPAYLQAHPDIDPATLLATHHIPVLIGGIKSNQFVIREQDASDDEPHNPDARIDLGKVVVAGGNMRAFGNFFTAVESQADAQYDIALIETQQALADAAGQGANIRTLIVPDTVNSSATGYFTRLQRLAQDTGVAVAIRVVDHDHGDTYESFSHFEPVSATSVEDYWCQRAEEQKQFIEPPVSYGRYAAYTMENVYIIDRPPTAASLERIIIPTTKYPLVFTSFEQLQRDFPGAPISDPDQWEENKQKYELVASKAEYDETMRRYHAERDDLQLHVRHTAYATSAELRQLLLDNDSHDGALSAIRTLAFQDKSNHYARFILAKIGDPENEAHILHEIRTQTGGYGDESLTTAPLGIHLRHNQQLLDSIMAEVNGIIATDPANSPALLPLLGALHHSHEPRIGQQLANYLTVPTQHAEAYAEIVLHAAVRWLPEYTMALAHLPYSPQRDTALRAIAAQTAAFVDADNKGRLDGLHTFYAPSEMLPLLLWFADPEHQSIAKESVMKQFKAGGSIITASGFERAYLLYRAQYGDLPEVSQYIHIK